VPQATKPANKQPLQESPLHSKSVAMLIVLKVSECGGHIAWWQNDQAMDQQAIRSTRDCTEP
jgi:hypothetical protein